MLSHVFANQSENSSKSISPSPFRSASCSSLRASASRLALGSARPPGLKLPNTQVARLCLRTPLIRQHTDIRRSILETGGLILQFVAAEDAVAIRVQLVELGPRPLELRPDLVTVAGLDHLAAS